MAREERVLLNGYSFILLFIREEMSMVMRFFFIFYDKKSRFNCAPRLCWSRFEMNINGRILSDRLR